MNYWTDIKIISLLCNFFTLVCGIKLIISRSKLKCGSIFLSVTARVRQTAPFAHWATTVWRTLLPSQNSSALRAITAQWEPAIPTSTHVPKEPTTRSMPATHSLIVSLVHLASIVKVSEIILFFMQLNCSEMVH